MRASLGLGRGGGNLRSSPLPWTASRCPGRVSRGGLDGERLPLTRAWPGTGGGAAERGGMPPARLGPTDAAVPRQGKGRNGMRDQRLLPGLQAAAAGGSVGGV